MVSYWYFPDGTSLSLDLVFMPLIKVRELRVDISCNTNANSPTGIYRCDNPTNDIHDDTDISVGDTVYVGFHSYPAADTLMCPGPP